MQQAGAPARDELITRALRLVTASVIFGLLSGTPPPAQHTSRRGTDVQPARNERPAGR
jgi:hypothetical protein